MFRIKQEPDALDLTNRPQHLLSPTTDHDDDEEEDSLPKVNHIRKFSSILSSLTFLENNLR